MVFFFFFLSSLKPAFDLIEQIKKQSPVAWAYYNSDNAMGYSTDLFPVVEYQKKRYFIINKDKNLKSLSSVYQVFKEKPTYMLEKSYFRDSYGKILLVPLDGSPEATIPEWLAKKFYYKENEFFLIKEKTGWWRPVKKIELVKS